MYEVMSSTVHNSNINNNSNSVHEKVYEGEHSVRQLTRCEARKPSLHGLLGKLGVCMCRAIRQELDACVVVGGSAGVS